MENGVRMKELHNKYKELYNKYKEYILYLFFGGLTTAVNFIIYYPLINIFHVDCLVTQAIAWFGAVMFAFFTNRIWVFESKACGREIFYEFFKFITGRLFSLGVQTVILYILVYKAYMNENIAIIPVMVIVVILNYILSKIFAFEKTDKDKK